MEAHHLSTIRSINRFGVYKNSNFEGGDVVYFNALRFAGELPQNLVVGNVALFLFQNAGPETGGDEMLSREQRLIDTGSRHYVASECPVPRVGAIFGHVASLYEQGQLWLSRTTLAGNNDWRPDGENHVGYQRTAARLIHAAVCGITSNGNVHSMLSPDADQHERAFYERIGMEIAEYTDGIVGASAPSATVVRTAIGNQFDLSEGIV